MHQTRVIAALRQHPGNDVFLADMVLGDVLDAHTRLRCQRRRAFPHTLPQRCREVRVVENANTSGINKSGHPLSIAITGTVPVITTRS